MNRSAILSPRGVSDSVPQSTRVRLDYALLLFSALFVASGCSRWRKAQTAPIQGDHFHPDRCLCDIPTSNGFQQGVAYYDPSNNGYDTVSLRQFEFCQDLPATVLLRCDSVQQYLDRLSLSIKADIAFDPILPRSLYFDYDQSTFIDSDSTRYNPEDRVEIDGDSYTPISPPASVDPNTYTLITGVGIDGSHLPSDSTYHTSTAYYTFVFRDRVQYPEGFSSGLGEVSRLSVDVMGLSHKAVSLTEQIEDANFDWRLILDSYVDGGITAQELPSLQWDIRQHNEAGYSYWLPTQSTTLQKLSDALGSLQYSYGIYEDGCPGSLNGTHGLPLEDIDFGRSAYNGLDTTNYSLAIDTFGITTSQPNSCFTVSPQGQNITISAQAGCETMTYTVSISSLSGVSIANFQASNGLIDLSSYLVGTPPGIYLVTVVDINGVVQTLKISR